MKLFEYDVAIENAYDEETGEILEDVIKALNMEKNQKIENIAMWWKEMTAEADAIKTEKQKLADRQRVLENKAESVRKYLDSYLSGQKFKTAKVAISYRKSSSVVIDDLYKIPEDFLRYSEPTPDKNALKDALKNCAVDGCHIEEKTSMSIK